MRDYNGLRLYKYYVFISMIAVIFNGKSLEFNL